MTNDDVYDDTTRTSVDRIPSRRKLHVLGGQRLTP